MSARVLRGFFELGTGVPGGRGFSSARRDIWLAPGFCPPVFFAALCLAGAPARSPAREWALHPATAVCEVAAAPAERVAAGCAFSAAGMRRHSTSRTLPGWQGAEVWRASTGARDMALVRAPAASAGKRKTGRTVGKTTPRRGENAAGARPVRCAETTDPAARGGQAPAGAKRGPSRRGRANLADPARRRSPWGANNGAGRRAALPPPVARGGRIFASGARGGGTMSAPAWRRPARPPSRLPWAAHTPRAHGVPVWAAAVIGGGGSPCARLPDGGERPAPIAPRHDAAGETRRKTQHETQ